MGLCLGPYGDPGGGGCARVVFILRWHSERDNLADDRVNHVMQPTFQCAIVKSKRWLERGLASLNLARHLPQKLSSLQECNRPSQKFTSRHVVGPCDRKSLATLLWISLKIISNFVRDLVRNCDNFCDIPNEIGN